jgi:hypothetical protein
MDRRSVLLGTTMPHWATQDKSRGPDLVMI